jgi:predicted phosphodiesterase
MTMKTTLVLPDIQYPYHDTLALRKILNFAEATQPDAVLQIGDGIDFPQVSRWSIGTAGAYVTTLQEHVEGFSKEVLGLLRQVLPVADITWLEGNHDLRLIEFITKYAPALRVLDALKMESLFGLDELRVHYERGPLRIAPNTLAVHGHESSGYAAQPQAWDKKFMDRYGSQHNIVFGHTHQPFLTTRGFGYNGKIKPRFVMNVGSIMDPTHAKYVKDGAVSWTMSFGLLHDNGKEVWPELVTFNNRSFVYGGKRW